MALVALAALLGVQAEDPACLLQSQKRQALREVTCSHESETYDFSTWEGKLYSAGMGPPEGGIRISSFQPTSDCLQPAIFTKENGDDTVGNLLDCNCNALVMAGSGSTDSNIDDCTLANKQKPLIDLHRDLKPFWHWSSLTLKESRKHQDQLRVCRRVATTGINLTRLASNIIFDATVLASNVCSLGCQVLDEHQGRCPDHSNRPTTLLARSTHRYSSSS